MLLIFLLKSPKHLAFLNKYPLRNKTLRGCKTWQHVSWSLWIRWEKKTLPMGSFDMQLSVVSFTSASSTNSLQTGKDRMKSQTSVPHLFSHWGCPAAPAGIKRSKSWWFSKIKLISHSGKVHCKYPWSMGRQPSMWSFRDPVSFHPWLCPSLCSLHLTRSWGEVVLWARPVNSTHYIHPLCIV